jgi:predicted ATPase
MASRQRGWKGQPLGIEYGSGTVPRIAVSLLTSADVQATVQLYLAPLSTVAQTVMGLAALLGRTFGFELLAAAALIDQEALLLALDELLAQGIVTDVDGGGYTFSHALLQQAALATLSSAKRLLWQKRIAHARQQVAQGGE